MGHLNYGAIRKLAQKDMVEGLNLSSPDAYDHVCEGCALGKSHQMPFPKSSTAEYPKMGLLVVDLTGPMSVGTWTGMLYPLVVVECSCRFGTGKLLTKKDDTYNALILIITQLERQSRKKCQILRSDNGTDFINQNYLQVL
jgi:hypothetical protein